MDYEQYQERGLEISVSEGIASTVLLRRSEDFEGREIQHKALVEIWRAFDADSDVKAVLLTGVDDEFYVSVGRPGPGPGHPDVEKMWEFSLFMQGEVRALVHEMINFDKPVVAAVNGAASGAGLSVVMLSDISIMADDAWVFDPHIMLGTSAGDGAGGILPLYTGIAKAKLYLLTSDAINGVEASNIGLVSRSVPRAELMPVAKDYAERLARLPEVAVRYTKRGVNQWLQLSRLVSQDYSLTLETLSFYSGERERNPHTEWPPRQVP